MLFVMRRMVNYWGGSRVVLRKKIFGEKILVAIDLEPTTHPVARRAMVRTIKSSFGQQVPNGFPCPIPTPFPL